MKGNIFKDDFRDFITCLNTQKVEYLLVGGFAVIIHGYPRTTGDVDIWVNKTSKNYEALLQAFNSFKMPVFDMTLDKFMDDKFEVFRFGRPPARIDVMTKVLGLTFEKAFAKSVLYEDGELIVRVVHINDLIEAKKSSGRHRDLNDIENLNP